MRLRNTPDTRDGEVVFWLIHNNGEQEIHSGFAMETTLSF